MKNIVFNITKKISCKRIIKAAIAVITMIAVIASVPIMVSADVGNVYNIVYMISPVTAQALKPVNKSCEKEGVEVSVISSDVSGATATVYIGVTDKGAGVVESGIDLDDSYHINTSFDAACGCRFDKYDPDTNTAYYLLTISDINGNNIEKIKKKKITFTVGNILANKDEYNGKIDGIDLTNAKKNSKTEIIDFLRGYGGSCSEYADISKLDDIPCLVANGTPIASPTDYADITAIGFVDNKLHVQTFYKNCMMNMSHGQLLLKDKNGEEVMTAMTKLYTAEKTDEDSFEESIFDIPYDDISEYTLYGEFVTYRTRIDGNWNVTFKLDE